MRRWQSRELAPTCWRDNPNLTPIEDWNLSDLRPLVAHPRLRHPPRQSCRWRGVFVRTDATSRRELGRNGHLSAFACSNPRQHTAWMDDFVVISDAPDGTRHQQAVAERSRVAAAVNQLRAEGHQNVGVGQDAESAIPFEVWIVGVGLEPVDGTKSGQWRATRRNPR